MKTSAVCVIQNYQASSSEIYGSGWKGTYRVLTTPVPLAVDVMVGSILGSLPWTEDVHKRDIIVKCVPLHNSRSHNIK